MLIAGEGKFEPMNRIAVALISVAAAAGFAAAQTSTAPVLRGVGVPAPAQSPTFEASSNTTMLRHRGPTGSPCLEVGGFARRHTTVSNLYDHVVAVKNNCAQQISIQVCYF